MKKSSIKLIALILLIVCTFSLVSCKSQPIKTGKDALVCVGTVGDYEVTYEELYFLSHNYRETLDAEYGEDASTSNEMITVTDDEGTERSVKLSEHYYDTLSDLISENITANYAVLTLAEEAGISLDDEDVQEEIQKELDLYIASEFGGKRRAYKKYLDQYHMTDNYVRFSIGVDVLYSRLTAEYLNGGEIETDDEKIRSIIEDEFVRTWHVMIINNDESDYETACEVLEKIRSGESSVYEMIGSKYNEDFMNTTLNGYYFTKGSMDKAYEDAAYDLEVGEVSDVVTAIGEDYYGNRVTCYYIIERLELEDSYIDKNFDQLESEYVNSIVYDRMEKKQASLEFKPNDYYASLSLIDIEEPRQIDTFMILISGGIVLGVAVVLGVSLLLVRREKNKIKSRKKRV